MTDLIDRLADLGRTPIGPSTHRLGDPGGSGPGPVSPAAPPSQGRNGGTVALRRGGRYAAWLSSAGSGGGATVLPPWRPRLPGARSSWSTTSVRRPQGFDIGTVPQGYDLDLQASTAYTVVIAPAGDADKDPDSFAGKLVVSAEDASSFAALSSLGTQSVTVGGVAGRTRRRRDGHPGLVAGREHHDRRAVLGQHRPHPRPAGQASPPPSRRRPSCSCRRADRQPRRGERASRNGIS